MSAELPRDAEGREIPLDTRRLYDEDGERKTVFWFVYSPTLKHWMVTLDEGSDGMTCAMAASHFHLIQPDSWEALEEDFDRCIEKSNSCWYFSPGGNCSKCARPDSDKCGCTALVFKDIKRRIRKLRGEDSE